MPLKRLLLTVSKRRGHATLWDVTWEVSQEAEGPRGKCEQKSYCDFLGKEWARQG